jgi:hypothetical protein
MSEENHAQDIYKMTPRQVRASLIDCIQAGLVPFVQSSPGMGKSSLVRSVNDEFGMKLIDHRVSTSSPVDFSGLPDFYTDEHGVRRSRFLPFDIFPTDDMQLPKSKKGELLNGWTLFLDEFNSGSKSVQAAAYKLILDKQVGQSELHPNVAIVLAGNLMTDRAIVNQLSTAMQSRVVHIEMILSFDEWLKDVAIPEKYDHRVVAYLSYKREKGLMDFRPDHNEKTFCCPRTWEFVNKLVRNKPENYDLQKSLPLLGGTITSGVAADFVTFSRVFGEMVQWTDVVKDPDGAEVPGNPMTRWAVITHLIEHTTEDNLSKMARYVNRYPNDFRMLYFRYLLTHQPKMRRHSVFADMMVEISKYLND